MFESALRAPDHGRLRPWRFVVVPEDRRERFGELMAECLHRQQPDASTEMLQRERDKAMRAPVIVVVAAQIHRGHKIPDVEQLVSAAAAAENIMLAANAQGFGAMWKTGAPAYDATVKRALGLDPDSDIVGFLYVGTQIGGGSPAARPVVKDLVSVWQG
jgi:nitroreductase